MYPDGRAAWVFTIAVIIGGSVVLSAAGLTVLGAEPISWRLTDATAAAPTGNTLSESPAATSTPSAIPIRRATPILTRPAPPAVATPQQVTYVVVRGDVLDRIARKFGVSTSAIAEQNDLVAPYRLEVGQILLIPNPE